MKSFLARASRPPWWPRLIALLAFLPMLAGADTIVEATRIVTAHDSVPRFCAAPDTLAVNSGSWSDPSNWSTGQIPAADARVLIGAGFTITYDAVAAAELSCVEIGASGVLRWAADTDTRLKVTHMQILPGGSLQIGSASAPIAADNRAEIIINDRPLDTVADPAQYGSGIHIFGQAHFFGAPRAPSFMRVSRDARAGDAGIDLNSQVSGWAVGDRLIVPDTRQIAFTKNKSYTSRAEEPVVAGIAGDTIALASPLSFAHYGPRDADNRVSALELEMLLHVGNLSRNIVVRSQLPGESAKTHYCRSDEHLTNSASCVTRGHVMAHDRADIDIRYAAFINLGRTTGERLSNTEFDASGTPTNIGTNQIGRYSFHIHHLAGPRNPANSGHQFYFVGNVIEGFLKWGLTVHDAHYGLISDNVVYDGEGAAIATEQGNESFNVFERNFIVHTKAATSERITESPGRAGVELSRALFGHARDGFWFSGMNNRVRNNVVANAPGFAYNYNGYYLTPHQPVPDHRGADMASESTLMTALPALEFTENEAYGATGQALWLTWSRGCCSVGRYDQVSLFDGLRAWHINHTGIEAYHESRNTFRNVVLRNDPAVSAQSGGGSLRFNVGIDLANRSYENGQTIIEDADIQGFNVGVRMTPRPEDGTDETNINILRNSRLKNYVNVQQRLPNIDERWTALINVLFEPLAIGPTPGLPAQPTNIQMTYFIDRQTRIEGTHGRMFVFNFNSDPAADFEIFFTEQGPDYPIPPPPAIVHPNYHVCPTADLTNTQCFAQHGVAVSGVIAPCAEYDNDPDCSLAQSRAQSYGSLGLVFREPADLRTATQMITSTTGGDADDDGLADAAELDTYHTDVFIADSDGDGLSDGAEVNGHRSNPLVRDTDGDGVEDGEEVANGTDPLQGSGGANVASVPMLPVPAVVLFALLVIVLGVLTVRREYSEHG